MEDDLKPMTEGDVTSTESSHAIGGAAEPESAPAPAVSDKTPVSPLTLDTAKQRVKDHAGAVSQQASDKAMLFAQQGKERAVGALEQLSKLIEDAAGQIDEKLGGNGQYVRTAAGTVQGFADQLREKKVDDLVDEARAAISKSPGVAIGAAAAVGFVVARLVSAGFDQRDA